MDKNAAVTEYIKNLTGVQKDWMQFFVDYMRKNHADLPEVVSFKMPTYQLGSGQQRNYIAFFCANNHFSMHSMDFEWIAAMKKDLKKPGAGKGCVHVGYHSLLERGILMDGIEQIIQRKIGAAYGK